MVKRIDNSSKKSKDSKSKTTKASKKSSDKRQKKKGIAGKKPPAKRPDPTATAIAKATGTTKAVAKAAIAVAAATPPRKNRKVVRQVQSKSGLKKAMKMIFKHVPLKHLLGFAIFLMTHFTPAHPRGDVAAASDPGMLQRLVQLFHDLFESGHDDDGGCK